MRECFCFGSEAVNASGEAVNASGEAERRLVKSRVFVHLYYIFIMADEDV